ncbi:MAG: 3-phosphoglycerate dehydrogenase family protein [Eubacteriaceae bacterium]|nr:3-phosphoglycerate dehydrogenase family protein [Eubacteriaceae bacterium]
MYKISTLNKISPVGLGRLGDQYTISENLEEAAGIIVRSADMHEMDFSSNLMAIGRAGAGVNNIPLDKCAEQGIVVFNAPGANANAVKELVIAGMLMASRNIPSALSWARGLKEDVKKTVEKGKSQFAGNEISGKTLGVIGLGAIGVMVANSAHDLGLNVVGYDPFISLKSAHALDRSIPVVADLAALLPQCDYVTIHVPVMEDTKGMMDARRFAQMKDGAVLLNFARDTLVNDEAVLEALSEGKLKYYVTDFPNDTVINKEGVIATPHLGASTAEAEDNCAIMAAEQLMDYIENGNIVNSVNYPQCFLEPSSSEDTRICILNKNIPSVLGSITGMMADMGINIDNMTNASKGDYACTLMDAAGLKAEAVDEVEASIAAIDGIIKVRIIK